MTTPARARYAGYRFPAEIIGHGVWLFRLLPSAGPGYQSVRRPVFCRDRCSRKPIKIIRELIADPTTVITRG